MKIRNFGYLNQGALKGQILFTGSSLMEMFPVCEIARSQGIEQVIYNRGVGGLNTDEFLDNIDTLLLDLEPSKIFINIGTNDITKERFGNQWMSHLMDISAESWKLSNPVFQMRKFLSWRFILQIFTCHGRQNNQFNG